MENIILSILLFKPMTVYEIRMYVQRNLNTICSDSLGSIQIAIKKLLKKGYIVITEYKEKGLTKKRNSITKEGIEYYKGWIGSPINIAKMTNMEESKLYFLGIAPKEKRISFLKKYISDLKGQHSTLEMVKKISEERKDANISANLARISNEKEIVDNLAVVSKETDLKALFRTTYAYQVYLLEYGLNRTESDIAFYEKILKFEMRG
ncbi:MAG: PadR family transcriptional regulator [Bacilli bacterium]|nr:PadR family transcriptional regulator [Bacilli bacterium]